MRIREIYIHDFRSFRGPNRISFVNPVTDMVHPVSVIAGPNGSGKSTILEAIASILGHMIQLGGYQDPTKFTPSPFVEELNETGLICLSLEISSVTPVHTIYIAVGRGELLPDEYEQHGPNLLRDLAYPDTRLGVPITRHYSTASDILSTIGQIFGTSEPVNSGLILLPHDRQLSPVMRGAIEPPTEKQQWVSRFKNSDAWEGSLQQLWVWQNYLDLESGKTADSSLGSFVETVESILGEDRKIKIEQGQVTIPAGWANGNGHEQRIGLDQLPSGEQQVLLLFGELAKRRRPNAIIAIDEVENSLHPTMQRLVMSNLRTLAREWDSQVIVTTHSQDVLNSVRGSAAILLGDLHQSADLNGHHQDELRESSS